MVAVDYNKNMHLVDKLDMQISAIEFVRIMVKWHKKLFLHILDVTILNSYNIFVKKTGKKNFPMKI